MTRANDFSEAASPRIKALHRSGLLDRSPEEQFGHLTNHVRDVLDVPVAIISLVDENRQVFAGHSGLPSPWAEAGETPISHSFCQHVVDRQEVLVVTDAPADPLVWDNPAIGDLGVVAYLGVPLALPTGEIVGALAAIDSAPRGWTEADLRRLRSIARTVEKEIGVRISESRWRTVFESMQEGFYVVRAMRGEDGNLVDVLFEEANPALERLTGIPVDRFIGARLSELVPDVLNEMLPVYESVLRSGLTKDYANRAELMGGRWFENRIRRLDEDRLASNVTDVTSRRQAELSLAKSETHWRGLFEQLHEGFVLGRVIRDEEGKVIDWRYEEVNRAWGELVGVPSDSVVGKTIREVFPGIEDEWVMDFAEVVDTGKASTFVRQVGAIDRWYEGHSQAIGPDTFVVLFMEVTERLKAEVALRASEQKQRLLNQELAHRMKNTLAMVQAIATQTLRQATSMEEGRTAISARLQALARAQDILTLTSWEAADIGEVVQAALAPHRTGEGRISCEGPKIELTAQQSLGLSLAVHELATNALKYGALSNTEGKVLMRWSNEGNFRLEWIETGGPPVRAPDRRGFGSKLIERIVAAYFNGVGHIAFDPGGVHFVLTGADAD